MNRSFYQSVFKRGRHILLFAGAAVLALGVIGFLHIADANQRANSMPQGVHSAITDSASADIAPPIRCESIRTIYCGSAIDANNGGENSTNMIDGYHFWDHEMTGPEQIYLLNSGGCYLPICHIELSGMSEDLDLFVLSPGCRSDAVVARGDNSVVIDLDYRRGDYYVAVDGRDGAVSYYTLTVRCLDNPSDFCAEADLYPFLLDETGVVRGYEIYCFFPVAQYHNTSDPGPTGCTGRSEAGNDCMIALDLEEGCYRAKTWNWHRVSSLYLLRDCSDPTSCIAGIYGDDDFELNVRIDDPGRYYLFLDESGISRGYINNRIGFSHHVCNDTCETSTELPSPGSYTEKGAINNADDDYAPPAWLTALNGKDMIYKAELESGMTFSARITPYVRDPSYFYSWDPVMYLVADCSDISGTCKAGVNDYGLAESETLVYTAEESGTHYLIIDNFVMDKSPGSRGEYALSVDIGHDSPATPTSSPGEPEISIDTNKTVYRNGGTMQVDLSLGNPGTERTAVLYVAVEAAGSFYFWPVFSHDLLGTPITLRSGFHVEDMNIFTVQVGAWGPLNAVWYAALEIAGEYIIDSAPVRFE